MAEPRSRIYQIQAPVLLVLLLAVALRLFRLGADSLWYDETVSVTLAGKDLAALVAHTAGDIHPPGYYLLLHFWQSIAGRSDFAAAFLSLFFGVLLVALAYGLARRLFGARAALIAAWLVAISPYNVWYSQEVRMYTLGAALVMIVVGAAICYWQAAAGRRGGAVALGLVAIAGALGLWTLYYFAFLLVALNLLVIGGWLAMVIRRRQVASWRRLASWLLAQVVALLLYAPWLPIAWRQATDPPVPPWRSFTGAWDVLLQTWTALGLGQSAAPSWAWPALLVLAVWVGWALLARGVTRAGGAGTRARVVWTWFLAGCVFLPVILIYLASLVTPLFHVRYVFTYSTPFYLVAAVGAAWLWRRSAPAGAGALALVTLLACASLFAYHTSPRYAADDHRRATAFLADAWRPGDIILVNAGYAYPALLTYWPQAGVEDIAWRGRLVDGDPSAFDLCPGPALLMTGAVDGDPNLGWGDPSSDFYAMTRQQTEQSLERLFATYHRLWVYRIYDTVTDPDGLIRDWLDDHGVLFSDQVFSGESQLRVQGYLTGSDPLAGTCRMHETGMPVGDGSLALTGLKLPAAEVEVGGVLDLAVLWDVNAPLAYPAYLFAGLFDEQGGRWAQVDEQPAGPLYPVTQWVAGGSVRTPLRLKVPASTPPGEYRVELGWYFFEAGQPVWLPWPDGDRQFVSRVRVVPPAAGWTALPIPQPAYTAGIQVGGVRLLGFEASTLEKKPGETLALDLFWQGGEVAAEPAAAVLRLVNGQGGVVGEWASAPVDGRAPFPGLAPGQVIRDPRTILLPASIEPGLYSLEVGRRTMAGEWLTARRGTIPLGPLYPLATVRVLGQEKALVPPVPQNSQPASFGTAIRFLGYDLDRGARLRLTLYWQSIEPVTARYKVAVHLLGDGGPGDIRAQADAYPHPPTTNWLPGEYPADTVELDWPASVEQTESPYTLWLALYEDSAGTRLPVYGAGGVLLGDGLVLGQVWPGE